MSDRDTVFLRS